MILLSSHIDTVKPEIELKFDNAIHYGLLDNIIGVIATYLTIYNNKSIEHLIKTKQLKVFHSLTEEFGSFDLPKLNKKDIAIVIDCCKITGKENVIIENPFNFTKNELKDLTEFLLEENINFKFNYKLKDDDEAKPFSKQKVKTLSVCYPIKGTYHDKSEIEMEKLTNYVHALQRIICYLVTL